MTDAEVTALAELAKLALQAIAKIASAVLDAHAGKTDPQVVLAAIQSLHDGLSGNNAAADAELAAKFDTSSTP